MSCYTIEKPEANFTNILLEAYLCKQIPKAQKTDGLTVFSALLGSAHLKAPRETLGKATNLISFRHEEVQVVPWQCHLQVSLDQPQIRRISLQAVNTNNLIPITTSNFS